MSVYSLDNFLIFVEKYVRSLGLYTPTVVPKKTEDYDLTDYYIFVAVGVLSCISVWLICIFRNTRGLFSRSEGRQAYSGNYNEYKTHFQETWQNQRNQSFEYISKSEHLKELWNEKHKQELMEDKYRQQILEKGRRVNYLRKRLNEEYDNRKCLEEHYKKSILSEKLQQELTEESWKKKLQKELQQKQSLEMQLQKTEEMYQEKVLVQITLQCSLLEEQVLKAKNNMELKELKEQLTQMSKELEKKNEIILSIAGWSLTDRYLSQTVLKEQLATKWDPMPRNKTFIKVEVQKDTDEFRFVKDCFNSSSREEFQIVKIERIQNPYILGSCMLKKLEMETTFGAGNVREINLFHGTKARNVDNICENNFNWRKSGESTGSKFGRGVSFTPFSYYANHYSDKCVKRVMFLVRVLISKETVGNQNMEIPPLVISSETSSNLRFDTTVKQDTSVLVKYSDNDFYPLYLIHYSVLKPKNRKRRKRKVNTTNS